MKKKKKKVKVIVKLSFEKHALNIRHLIRCLMQQITSLISGKSCLGLQDLVFMLMILETK